MNVLKKHCLKYIYICVLILSCTVSAQEVSKTSGGNDFADDDRKQGSAISLEGKTYVLTVFTGNNQWEQKAIDNFYNTSNEAFAWLRREALRYNKKITFTKGSYGTPDPIEYDIASGTGSGRESIDVVYNVMKKIGYSRPLDFVQWSKETMGCSNCFVIVVVDKPGRSYSLTYNNKYEKEKFFLEGVVVYTRYEDGSPLCAASIAHEICHLFGAEDLYENFKQTKENELVARKLYPNDIMLRTSCMINKLTIDEMTAWFVGLTDDEKEWYKDFLRFKEQK